MYAYEGTCENPSIDSGGNVSCAPVRKRDKSFTMKSIQKGAYLAGYVVDCFLRSKRKPIAAGVPLTDHCNLSCAHCVVKNGRLGHHSFETICGWIDELYEAGARFLYLQGGEILLWKDGDKRPNDIIRFARERGFFGVACVTNGTIEMDLDADAIWVSVDGPEQVHDAIRGKGSFALMRKNVSASRHWRIYANITLNRMNVRYLEETVAEIRRIPRFRGISVNLHTPYPGVEDLEIPPCERPEVVRRVLALENGKCRILNSRAGLRNLATGEYERPSWMIRMFEQGRSFDCCWGRENPETCRHCGYGIISEFAAIAKLKPSAILSAFELF